MTKWKEMKPEQITHASEIRYKIWEQRDKITHAQQIAYKKDMEN